MTLALRHNGHANCVKFGNFLGDRYGTSPNVLWQHGNDYTSRQRHLHRRHLCRRNHDRHRCGCPHMMHTVEYAAGMGVSTYSLRASTLWVNNIQLNQAYPTSNSRRYTH